VDRQRPVVTIHSTPPATRRSRARRQLSLLLRPHPHRRRQRPQRAALLPLRRLGQPLARDRGGGWVPQPRRGGVQGATRRCSRVSRWTWEVPPRSPRSAHRRGRRALHRFGGAGRHGTGRSGTLRALARRTREAAATSGPPKVYSPGHCRPSSAPENDGHSPGGWCRVQLRYSGLRGERPLVCRWRGGCSEQQPGAKWTVAWGLGGSDFRGLPPALTRPPS